jgi:hypothetical protein
MKSPFVRFCRLVRSPLTLATVSLFTICGCRHLPMSQRDCDREDVAVASVPPESDEPLPRLNAKYDDPPVPPTVEVAEPRTVKTPIRTIPDVDLFLPEPRFKIPVSSQLPAATPPSSPSKTLPELFEDEPAAPPPTLEVPAEPSSANEPSATDTQLWKTQPSDGPVIGRQGKVVRLQLGE